MRKCKAVNRAVRLGSGHCKCHFPILVTITNSLRIINCSLYMEEGTGVFLKTLQNLRYVSPCIIVQIK